jgi:DNA-directed RNA polymerase subunit H
MRSSTKKKVDPLSYHLTPKHELLTAEQAFEVLKSLGVTPDQLPWMRASDPVAKAIGARPGDLVKVTRKNPLGGEVVIYRYIISG